MKKKWKWYLGFLVAVLSAALFASVPVSAESKAAKNKKAVALYEKEAKRINAWRPKYVDITGDGIKEALFYYRPKGRGGSGIDFVIYTYKNGKIKCILSDTNYGLIKIMVYKKSKSFIAYGAGHGGEWYAYFKMKSGEYKYIAEKSRRAKNGGSMTNGPWYYSTGNGMSYKSLTKSQFNKKIKSIKKGKKTFHKVEI